MKDLTFKDQNGSLNVTFRTSLISTTGAFTVLTINGLDPNNFTNTFREDKLATSFLKLPSTVDAFIKFATTNKLQLTMADSNGANSVILSRMWNQGKNASDSDSGS